jgi:hypothetical protein
LALQVGNLDKSLRPNSNHESLTIIGPTIINQHHEGPEQLQEMNSEHPKTAEISQRNIINLAAGRHLKGT